MKRQTTLCPCLSAPLTALTLVAVLLAGAISALAGQDPTGRPSTPPPKHKKPATTKPKDSPEPITVTLTILTQPPGSEVFVNGESKGTTDQDGKIQIAKMSLGHYAIEVRKGGFVTSARDFEAGPEAPTLVFKLIADITDKLKQFDVLMTSGNLIGPAGASAFDVADELEKSAPDRPEVTAIRDRLFKKLIQGAEQAADRTVRWRQDSRDDIFSGEGLAAKAEAVRPDDKHAQALDLFLQGAIALRDWQEQHGESKPAPAADGQGSAQQPSASEPGLADARAKFEKAIQLQDSLAVAQYQLGVALLTLRNPDAARGAFAKAAQLQPAWSIARIGIGGSFYASGKPSDAVTEYKRAVDIDPASSAAHAGLGLALAAAGQSKDAMKEIDKAISLDQTSGIPHLDLGLILSESKKKKDRDRAQDELKKAIEMNPHNLEFDNSEPQRVLASLSSGKKR
jgi:tetratricopeptide (TPR) repeat protein